jgi:hypothetical protein
VSIKKEYKKEQRAQGTLSSQELQKHCRTAFQVESGGKESKPRRYSGSKAGSVSAARGAGTSKDASIFPQRRARAIFSRSLTVCVMVLRGCGACDVPNNRGR